MFQSDDVLGRELPDSQGIVYIYYIGCCIFQANFGREGVGMRVFLWPHFSENFQEKIYMSMVKNYNKITRLYPPTLLPLDQHTLSCLAVRRQFGQPIWHEKFTVNEINNKSEYFIFYLTLHEDECENFETCLTWPHVSGFPKWLLVCLVMLLNTNETLKSLCWQSYFSDVWANLVSSWSLVTKAMPAQWQSWSTRGGDRALLYPLAKMYDVLRHVSVCQWAATLSDLHGFPRKAMRAFSEI